MTAALLRGSLAGDWHTARLKLERATVQHRKAAEALLVTNLAPSLELTPELQSLAAAVAVNLTAEERNSLLSGSHFSALNGAPEPGYYTGYINGVPRLKVPPLKMADAGNGFRTTDDKNAGTSTQWPSLLAMAATWDDSLVQRYAAAVGEEFRGKGANVILGPSINVHRVARNGRNFEYLSGEDPFLGSRLVRAYVRGVQSKGVIATIKHFAFNEQETNRMSESSEVDARTAWELYYPPFQAAVEAGAGAVMCSYNKINGTYACGNKGLIQRDLREKMGFKGIVMSDWQATHSSDNLKSGLDQEMPGRYSLALGATIPPYFNDDALNDESLKEPVSLAAQHVLETMYRFKLHENPGCVPPACEAQLASDQTSDKHRALAREAAAASVVLLQNDGILPLSSNRVKTLAVLGAASTTKYNNGGGSGYVFAKSKVSPLEALKVWADKAGIKITDNVLNADAALVVAGTNSKEGLDRASLSLDDNSDKLILETSKKLPTVVLLMIPGAVLTPWRSNTSAILALFLGGEESGNAAASVLFGDMSPAGKLPLMLPASEEDTIPPNASDSVPYSEGLLTSYRSPSFKAAFPFGHGLSYTDFLYGSPESAPLASCGASNDGQPLAVCVKLYVTNTGSQAGTEVVQAYLQLGSQESAEGRPEKVLKGFWKTGNLQPGQKQEAFIKLSSRDLSTYSAESEWSRIAAGAKLHIGASSSDIRHVHSL